MHNWKRKKIEKLSKISTATDQFSTSLITKFYLGNDENISSVFLTSKSFPLAYLAARNGGLKEKSTQILKENGINPNDVEDFPINSFA